MLCNNSRQDRYKDFLKKKLYLQMMCCRTFRFRFHQIHSLIRRGFKLQKEWRHVLLNCPFVHLSVCLFVCLSVCLFVCLSVCLFACLFVCLFICLSVCLFVRLTVCLFVYLFVWLFVRLTKLWRRKTENSGRQIQFHLLPVCSLNHNLACKKKKSLQLFFLHS